ncbi:LOW QUALITY PROTEIN: angiopoietin-related protein 1a [Hypomesus transpacificus]|uniref:LOW QUALITY PROTEIN: angiopoietin-related protein 1a n=1 Tax=Hypomesus transpacificus TaxID=137520 RepID=UPI001F08288D|nr:LOW QUALITY PROTEIN: angiopoietin-related protein 1a [Hypomesus transpacificus]
MRGLAWAVCTLLCLSLAGGSQGRRPGEQAGPGGSRGGRETLLRTRRSALDPDAKKCSYTFLIPEQKITGPICASSTGPEADKERVTRMDISSVQEVLARQRRELENLQLVVNVDGNMVTEMKLLRKESRNMNSRVTQLYMQLLHEIIRKRDNSLELAQLEVRILNVTSEMLRLASRYKELEARFSAMAGVVNNQSQLITTLEEQCMRAGGRGELPLVPPLVPVVPENLPVNSRFTNEIQRDHSRAFTRGSRMDSPTASPYGLAPPVPQGTLSSDGPFRDCSQVRAAGHSTSGMYLLQAGPGGGAGGAGAGGLIQAWCDQTLDHGGWTVLQRRRDGSVNFFRNWENYKKGFGNIDSEYWLGLDNMYRLSSQMDYKLLVELEDWVGKKVYAEYSSFTLEPESQGYRLRLGAYQGNAGDSLSSNNGKQFTTLDRDKDTFSGNCAHFHKGGWWYSGCGQTNLNGVWYSGGVYRSKFQDGIFWAEYGGGFYSLKTTRMMIRPID